MFLVHEENSRAAVTVVLHLLPRRGWQGEEEEGWWFGIKDFRMDLQGNGLKPPLHTCHGRGRGFHLFRILPTLSLSPEQFLGLMLLPKPLQASHQSPASNPNVPSIFLSQEL